MGLTSDACWLLLTNDGTTVPEAERLTAALKNARLDLLLGQIANFCPVISRNSIVKHSTSLSDIWDLSAGTGAQIT